MKTNFLHKVSVGFFLITALYIPNLNTVYAASKSESQPFIDYFNKNHRANIKSKVDELYWSGISDTRLFDIIESELKSGYMDNSKMALETNSWLVKGLAVSGNRKYIKTMEEIIQSSSPKKLKKHTENAIATLEQYSVWLPIMNKGIENVPISKRSAKRVQNMLESDNSEMIRIGAKRVYHHHIDDKSLVAAAGKSLIKNFNNSNESVHVDAMAWLIKALAQSRDSKHKETLNRVAQEGSNKKIVKYAKKYAEYL